MRTRRILSLVLAVALICTLGLAGCTSGEGGGGGGGGEPVAGGTMVYRISEPAFIDPYNAQESEGVQVVHTVFDSLTAIDPLTSKVIPAAAESWEPNGDGSVWTFKLVDGAKFHDGTPVTAADVAFAWNRMARSAKDNPENPSEVAYHLQPVKGFEEAQTNGVDMEGLKVVDDTTLEVTLSYPYADFPFVVAHPALAPVPKAAVEADPEGFAENPIGNGPFKMAEPWKHDQYVKVVKNTDYYGDEPYLDGVEFKIIKEEDTAFREFQAGTVDFTEIPSGQIESAKTQYGEAEDGYTVQPGKGVLIGPETAIYYMAFQTQKKPLDNQKLREAISFAINRQALADTVYEGTRKPATNFVPPGILGYEDNAWPTSTYDIDKAKQLLADAGYPEGKGLETLKINYNTGGGHEDAYELIRSDLKALGINTTMEGLEFPQHIDKMQAGDFQLGRAGWIADYPIMDNFLYPEFQSESADNWSKFNDPTVDADLLKARGTVDEAARVALFQDIDKRIGAKTPVVPLVYYAHRHVGSNRLNDFVYDAIGLGHFETAWMTDGGAESQ